MAIQSTGERTRRVTIQVLSDTVDDSGFPIEEVASSFTTQASRVELRGFERFAAEQTSAVGDSRWQIPYRASMDPELVDVPKVRRLVASGRTYDITGAIVIGQKQAIELMTKAKVG